MSEKLELHMLEGYTDKDENFVFLARRKVLEVTQEMGDVIKNVHAKLNDQYELDRFETFINEIDLLECVLKKAKEAGLWRET